jgi:hypothetical protein
MRRVRVAAWALVLALGGGARADEPERRAPGAPGSTPAQFPEAAAFLGLSGAGFPTGDGAEAVADLAGMGVSCVETLPIRWEDVEPVPPPGGAPRYLWQRTDEGLAAWQAAGFVPVLVLSPASSWASERPDLSDWARFAKERLPAADAALAVRGATGAAPPKAEHWRDWQRFVRDVVERYDGDGRADAPGLRRPLRHVQVLDQVQRATRWVGSAEEYLRLLHHAREGIDEAGASCEVVHAAVDLRGLVRAGDERPDEWRERLAREVPATPPVLRAETERGVAFVLRSLEMARLFDVLPHAGSGNLLEDEVNLRALRALLRARSVTNVAVWLTQSPTRRLARARVRLPDDRVEAAEETLRRRALALARSGASTGEALAAGLWLRHGTAHDLVRGAARARLAGAARVLTYAPFDRVPPVPGEDPLDTDDQGFLLGGVSGPVPGAWRRPSWYAARQMNRLLLGHRSASEAPLGAPGTAVMFLFPEQAPLPWVAVLLPDLGTWAGEPGKPPPTRAARVPLPDGDVDVEEIALADGPPVRRRMKVSEGLLALELSPGPLYVYPAR